MDLARVFRIAVITAIVSLFMTGISEAQVTFFKIDQARIDSLLARYHLEGVKIFVKKLGVISLNEKQVSLKRNMINDKLYITLQKNLSFDESGFGARFDYKLRRNWLLRGDSYQRNWGRQSALSVLYRFEY